MTCFPIGFYYGACGMLFSKNTFYGFVCDAIVQKRRSSLKVSITDLVVRDSFFQTGFDSRKRSAATYDIFQKEDGSASLQSEHSCCAMWQQMPLETNSRRGELMRWPENFQFIHRHFVASIFAKSRSHSTDQLLHQMLQRAQSYPRVCSFP